MKRLNILLLLMLAGLFSSNAGAATIVYIPDGGFQIGNTEGELVSFEFSELSETLIFRTWFRNPDGAGDELWWIWTTLEAKVQGVAGTDSSAARLDAGVEIGEDWAWGDVGREVWALTNETGDGPFYDSSGFVGVRVFENRAGWNDPNALPYYGWIRVEHHASAGTLTVHDWAWNSVPGEPILAGAIPEPRVYALGFGMGVFGFVLLRRWRRRWK